MLFSADAVNAAEKKFNSVIEKAGKVRKNEIITALTDAEKVLSQDVIFAVKWLYAHSPLSDIANCDFSLFAAFAEHGVYLRQNSPYASAAPEEIFLNYVLATRMGGEEISDCRKFFYDKLVDRVKGLSMYEAVIEANYFCAENVTYCATDFRTMSAKATYNAAYGRCGEESVFAVNVFRAIGIPARQVYTPRWAHCDSNHAWVEVWCDGRWYFLGACEPEELLDRGWFIGATGRAMIINSICFGDPMKSDEILNRVGVATALNCLDTYAVTKKLTVSVKDAQDSPVVGAKVVFSVLNNSHLFPCSTMITDSLGKTQLTCGYGSLNVRVISGDVCMERILPPEADAVEFVLKSEQPVYDKWENFTFTAPLDGAAKGAHPTDEQKKLARQKTALSNAKRELRVAAMYNEAKANAIIKKYGYTQRITEVLKESRDNFDNICAFLEGRFDANAKEELLLTLEQKDWCDIDVSVLTEALEYSEKYNSFDKEIFYPYIACPRVWWEHLSVCRRFIDGYFTEEQKTAFRADPKRIWQYVGENVSYEPEAEYGQIITKPIGALTVKKGTPLSRKVLFVNICRTLGIPARLNPINDLAEFYDKNKFISLETLDEGDCTIVLTKEDGESMQYYSDFCVGVLDNGNYVNLEPDEEWADNRLELKVKSGEYRIITDNRLPNGNIYAAKYHFVLGQGETKTIKLRKYQADLSEMLLDYKLDEFNVKDGDGGDVPAGDIADKAVMIWLDEGSEPTEHLLNEMLEREAEFKAITYDIIFMLSSKNSSNAKLDKVLKTFEKIKVYYDSSNIEPLARRLFLDPEKLPLIVVTRGLKAVYASSGYNVGSSDMILKIIKYSDQSK